MSSRVRGNLARTVSDGRGETVMYPLDPNCSFSYTVRISIARETQQCKGEEMTRIDDEYTADIKAVSQRIAALVQFELEPVEYAILEFLQRSKCFTPTQLQLLEWLEQKHLDT